MGEIDIAKTLLCIASNMKNTMIVPILSVLGIFLGIETTLLAQQGVVSEPIQASVQRVFQDPLVVSTVRQAQERQCSMSAEVNVHSNAPSQPHPISGESLWAFRLSHRPRILGFQIDAGVPAGIGLSFHVQPWRWVRLNLGATHNLAQFGIRGGITGIPFPQWVFSPTIHVEGGHAFAGDANGLAQLILANTNFQAAALRRVEYDYASGMLGAEIGNEIFRFMIYGGVSYVHTQVHDLQQTLRTLSGDNSIIANDPTIDAVIPSGRVGFLVHFY